MRALVPLLAALSAVSALAVVPSKGPQDRSDSTLHPAVRAVIDKKMAVHAQEMTDLVMLVVLLEREDAADAADRIAAEPLIGRAIGPSDSNAGVPEQFFVLQKQLTTRATALSTAARASDDAGMARAFGELTSTCVACHTRYLDEPL